MLLELSVHNLAVIQETRLVLGPGLNVVTGDTGAGKSLLIDALELVLGGRPSRDLIRAGAALCTVEAVFQLPAADPSWRSVLAERGVELDDDGVLTLARELHPDGRSVSRLNGRAVPVSAVRAVGDLLVDIHGQGSHLSLLDTATQLDVLDTFGGLSAIRERVAGFVTEVRRLQHDLATLTTDDRQSEQRRDLLAFQVDEIASAQLALGEDQTLLEERDLLANALTIQEACAAAYDGLYAGSPNAGDLIAAALQDLRRAPDPSGALATQAAALEAAAAQVDEAARELRAHGDSIEDDPQRLGAVEERLELVRLLKRKYGDSIAEVLAFAEAAQRELESLDNAGEHRAGLESALAKVLADAGAAAGELSGLRGKVSELLTQAVTAELADLALASARFEAAVHQRESDDGLPTPAGRRHAFTARGIDEAAFVVTTNPGEGLKPLARVASGGETSRLMLAIKGALQAQGKVPTLVFDEIDSGVGGRAGDVVGKKLLALSRHCQVLCVTHLPQIAAFADRHFRVGKEVLDDRTFAGAQELRAEERVQELAVMLGGTPTPELDGAARQMLEQAAGEKR